MKIKTIHFGDNDKPESLVVEMDIREAAEIADWSGRTTTIDTSSIYHALATNVFHSYWEDGIDGYRRGDDE